MEKQGSSFSLVKNLGKPRQTVEMESNFWTGHKNEDEEEFLLANVVALRSQLKETERSLQNLGEELSSSSEGSHCISHFTEIVGLSLEDLIQPNCSEYQNYSGQKSACKVSHQDRTPQKKSKTKSHSVSAAFNKSMEKENEHLKEKLSILHEQNSSLVSQNYCLMNKIETINLELAQSKTRISLLESALGTHSVNIPLLEEQIVNLEAEVTAQDKVLRDAENKLEYSQKMVVEKEHILQRFKEECKKLKMDLIEQSKQRKRAELQRNEALFNAEELTKALKKYREKITEKLEKVQAEEEVLERNLINCEKEREKLHEKCVAYRNELESTEEQLRLIKEENRSTREEIKCLEEKNTEIVSLLTQSKQKILKLESELTDKEVILKEKKSLISENVELKALTAQQNDRLKLCHQEIEDSREELGTLESIISQLSLSASEKFKLHHSKCQLLSSSTKEANSASCCESNKSLIADLRIKLAMKEAEIQKLQANLTVSKVVQHLSDDQEKENGRLYGLETEPVKLTGNRSEVRRCQQLELISKQFEKEKRRYTREIEELHAKLTNAKEQNSSLKTSMSQRASQFQIIQEELLEKAAKTSRLEREITKKSSQLSALEKQLEEKTVAFSSAAARNAELEQEIMEKNDQIRNLETSINKEHEHITISFEKAKLIHLEQRKEMEKQIEILQTQLNKKHEQFNEQEKTMSILQQDILCKQQRIESLDQMLIERREEMEKQNVKKDEALKILQNQLTEEMVKGSQLESALDICKEELAVYLSQLDESKDLFEKQLKKKSEEVQRLQKEVKLKNQSLQDTSEQNVLLQQTLHRQQQMLQEETIRNGELEDSQLKLEKQVSKLEQELQKQRENLEEELRKAEGKLNIASQEADLKRQKVTELTSTIRQIKLEMDQCKDELIDMEKELIQLRRDGETKTIQLNQLGITLEQLQSEVNKKTNQVTELEDKLLQSETCHKNALQKIAELEAELQNAHGELKITLRQLQDLREILQNAQLSLEEKYAAIKDLTAELRQCKGEIADKKQELLDMDQALKERNWELKQRAAQVTQLDMTIREHRGEMEQKIIRLEGSLEKSELEIKECNKQIESLDAKLQHSRDELREKEFELLQRDQEINQLKKEIERKEHRLTGIEKTMKNQEKCIADQYKEALDLGQQLRLEREQMQHIHLDLLETRRLLVQAQRETDRLSHELEEVNHLSQEKEARANCLAEELGAAQAHEAQLEARTQAEIKRLSAEIDSLKEAYELEKLAHQTDQEKWYVSIDTQKSGSQHLSGQLQQLKLELEEAQDTVNNLQQQLQARDEVVRAANEALLVKESQVTRLQTRIAGHERTEVYATMRNLSKKEKLEKAASNTLGKTLEIKQLDVCDEESIKTCVSNISERRIDILVSNAGMGLIGPIECQTIDEMKTVMDTNFFGLVRLLKEILPDMKKRKSGHIVIISSVMGLQGILFNDVYAASKFAVEGFCESLAIQALQFKLRLSLIEPGPVITEFEKKVYEDGMKMDLSAADEETAHMFTDVYLKNYNQIFQSLGQSAEEVAEHTVKIILAENPPFRHQTNTLYTPVTTLKYADPNGNLPIDSFYKMVFHHDRIFHASLNFFKLLRWSSRKNIAST
ncbi:PREDICTED: coiled-coil domain-containing protein 18 isoform X1 [Crocodylus porosus]|uniref:coiled-coil domain-containing protein 18 isoform X1 n=1 Tax=Crocodylus porosus TaxID=8502 RepID=UPI000939B1F1|nr:PREDICTED: coiled-coil domain-containing protein 18 isoform X1 [Crocodylus porosus]